MPDPTSPSDPTEAAAPNVVGYSSPPDASTAAVVWCRLLAICMLGWGLQTSLAGIVGTFMSIRTDGFDLSTIGFFFASTFPSFVWLSLALFCWTRAAWLTERMTRNRSDTNLSRGLNADELLSTLIIGIGIYLLSEGLPGIGRLIYTLISNARRGQEFRSAFDVAITAILRCLIGLWFILGNRGVLNLIRRHSGKWRDPSNLPTDT